MTTLAQFRTAVSSKVGLDNSTSGDQGLIDLWVNEGVADVVMRTGCRIRSATMSMTAGTSDYTLDTAIMKIYDAYVTVGSAQYQMEVASADDILTLRRTTTANASPAQYYAVAGSDLLMVYPTPATADTVTVYYVPRPSTLSISSDTPSEIPAEFQKAVEFYALREAADMSDDQSSQVGATYQALYEQWIKRINKWVWMKGNHRLPRAQVQRSPSTIPFHDRSTYPP